MQLITLLKSQLYRVARQLVAAYSHLRFAGKAQLHLQIDRHVEHWNLDNAIAISHALVPRLVAAGLPRDARILVVGCCNMLEIYTFLSYGFRHVRGIDLVSRNPRFIKVMDMHEMTFADASFDALYCAGVLHCTHTPEKLAAEFTRVLKPGALVAISVPIRFDRTPVYVYDVEDLDGLHRLFKRDSKDILWNEIIPGLTPSNPNLYAAVHTIFRVN